MLFKKGQIYFLISILCSLKGNSTVFFFCFWFCFLLIIMEFWTKSVFQCFACSVCFISLFFPVSGKVLTENNSLCYGDPCNARRKARSHDAYPHDDTAGVHDGHGRELLAERSGHQTCKENRNCVSCGKTPPLRTFRSWFTSCSQTSSYCHHHYCHVLTEFQPSAMRSWSLRSGYRV